jgi:hypothetical protein
MFYFSICSNMLPFLIVIGNIYLILFGNILIFSYGLKFSFNSRTYKLNKIIFNIILFLFHIIYCLINILDNKF